MKKRTLKKWISLLLTLVMAMQGAFPALAAEGGSGQAPADRAAGPAFVPPTGNVIFRQAEAGATLESLDLPATLTDSQGQAAEVREWLSEPEYTGQAGIYVFWAVMPEGREEASSAAVVTVRQPAVRMFKSSIGGGNNPVNIYTPAQLWGLGQIVNSGGMVDAFGNSKQEFTLQNDLDLSAYSPNDGSKGWTPIGGVKNRFTGTFDGNGHVIRNLTIDDARGSYIGLFGIISQQGVIKNLGIVDCNITGNYYTGAVAGSVNASPASIINCYSTGSVSGHYYMGGLVGDLTNCSITGCYSSAVVTGDYYIGGMAGRIFYGNITDCYGTGELTGDFYVGGMTGYVISGEISNCYVTATASGNYYVGGIVGSKADGSIKDCVALNSSVSGNSDVSRIVGYREINGSDDMSGNFAFEGMTIKIKGKDKVNFDDVLDGKDLVADDIARASFWTNEDGNGIGSFSIDKWNIVNGKLPVLKGVGGKQADKLPPHLNPNGYFDGEGTADSPYQISTAEELKELARIVNDVVETDKYNVQGICYKLMADIDLSAYASGKGWTPIGTITNGFKAKFDGNGYIISNLTINDGSSECLGLFGFIANGSVSNIGVVDCKIIGKSSVGGIVGFLVGNITNCYSTGSVSGSSDVGGIAGYSSTKITNCYSTCSVSGSNNVGGVMGSMYSDKATNCYSTGTVTGSNNVGGVVGYTYSSTNIDNCVALNPSVNGAGSVSRIVNGGTLSNNHAYKDMRVNNKAINSINAASKDGADATKELIATAEFWKTTVGFSEDDWTIEDNKLPILKGVGGNQTGDLPPHLNPNGYFDGKGTADSPYLISTAEELKELARIVNEGIETSYNTAEIRYELANNIDLSAYAAGKGWTPIGTYDNRFKAQFDGKGKVIGKLAIDDEDSDYRGLFGFIDYSGSVSNIGVVNCKIRGKESVGGVAGEAYGSITNCYLTGFVYGTNEVGGIAGAAVGGITNCYSTGSVSGTEKVGGVAGATYGGITNCYSTSSVSGTNEVGGIVGSSYSNIKNCVALNPYVNGSSNVYRIVGDFVSVLLSSNYAFAGMKVSAGTAITADADGPDGADVNIPAVTSISFWRSLSFDESIWQLNEMEMPTLKDAGGDQPSQPPLHLIGFAKNELILTEPQSSYSMDIPQANTTVNFTVSGMEGWTDSIIKWEATGGPTFSETATSSAILAIPAGQCKAVTVSAINTNSNRKAECSITFNVPEPMVGVLGSDAVNLGDSIKLTAEVTSQAGIRARTYAWYRNDTNSNTGGELIPASDSADFTVKADEAGKWYYYCKVTNENSEASGTTTATAISGTIRVTVSIPKPAAPTIANDPTSGMVNVGESVTLKATTVPDEPYTGVTRVFKWYRSTVASTTEEIQGATGNKLSVPTDKDGTTYYYCQVVDSQNGQTASSEMSKPFTVTVVDAGLKKPDKPSIAVEPIGGKVNKGEELTLTAAKSDPPAGVTRVYNWYKDGETAPVFDRGNVFKPDTNTVGSFSYYCVVVDEKKDAHGVTVSAESEKSDSVTVTVVDAGLKKPDKPSIAVEPIGGKVNKGEELTLTAATSDLSAGVTRVYNWYKDGETAPVFDEGNVFKPDTNTVGSFIYYCVVVDEKKDAHGVTVSAESEKSDSVTVTVVDAGLEKPEKPSIAVEPIGGKVNKGEELTLTATISDPPAGATRVYNWYKDGVTAPVYGGGNVFKPDTNTIGSFSYYCVVVDEKKDAHGADVSVSSEKSDSVTVTVADSPSTPSGGGGGGSAPAAPVNTGIIEVTDGDGKVIGSLDTSKAPVKEGTMVLTIDGQADEYILSINIQGLKDLADKHEQGILSVETPEGIYELHFDTSNIEGLDEYMAANRLKAENVFLRLSLRRLTGEELSKAQADYAARFPGGEPVTDFYDLSISFCTASGKVIGFAPVAFRSRISFGLKAEGEANGGFIYSGGQFAFVPMKQQSDMAMFATYHHSIYVAGLNDMAFTDTAGHWGESIIAEAANKGLVSGMGDGSYAPDKSVTRAQLITMIANALDLPQTSGKTPNYADVGAEHWAYDSVMRMKSAGMLNIYAGESLLPDKAASRQEMAALLAAAVRYEDGTLKAGNEDLGAMFGDADSIGSEYAEDVRLVCGLKIMQGKDGGMFAPQDTTTRAQAATVLLNMLRALGLI